MSPTEEYAKRMKDGMRIKDTYRMLKDRETTETFIKAFDPVRVETDRVSKVTYTIIIGEDKVCHVCDTHIEMGCAYITKRLSSRIHYSMCLECGCRQIEKVRDSEGHICPAPKQGNQCGSCRACWNDKVNEVTYIAH